MVVILVVVALLLAIIAGTVAGRVGLTQYLIREAHAASLPNLLTPARTATTLTTADADVLAAFEQDLIGLYQDNVSSVVSIRVTQKMDQVDGQLLNPFGLAPFGPAPQNPDDNNLYMHGLGSGFVWDTHGHIVTN